MPVIVTISHFSTQVAEARARERLAREVHDGVLQALAFVVVAMAIGTDLPTTATTKVVDVRGKLVLPGANPA